MRFLPGVFFWLVFVGAICGRLLAQTESGVVEIGADELEDKIRGGMLGQVFGNLNGLAHEFKYIDEPGQVEHYTPSLPDGAFTDDDTDIEWVYLREIVSRRESRLPPERIVALWKRHINRRIFAANHYARGLMDLGLEPPWTGNAATNPFSEFNISGQFVCESFGLMSPAMPQTAARTGLNYTHVSIDGEPAQTTQLFTAMIATAFVETDLDRVLDAGLVAIDPRSRVAGLVGEVRTICSQNRDDWKSARREIKTRWQTHGGGVRDRNGYELNTACTIAALEYGKGDFAETLRLAFNLGWDCDNNAAAAGTIVGVWKGRRWMDEQGWKISDVYRNTTRDEMPQDETLSGLENTVVDAARIVIAQQGGELTPSGGRRVYRIHAEKSANVEPLATRDEQIARLRVAFGSRLPQDLEVAGPAGARAAYLAICLGDAERLARESPAAWSAAVRKLEKHPTVLKNMFTTPAPDGERLRREAERAGVRRN